MANYPLVINKQSKRNIEKHIYKHWEEINRCILAWKRVNFNNKARNGKNLIMSELKAEWFIQETDYSSRLYTLSLNFDELQIGSFEFWMENLSNYVLVEDTYIKISIPYLYKISLKDLQLRRLFKEHSQKRNIWKDNSEQNLFHNILHKYMKCLSKRKSDILKKFNTKSQGRSEKKTGEIEENLGLEIVKKESQYVDHDTLMTHEEEPSENTYIQSEEISNENVNYETADSIITIEKTIFPESNIQSKRIDYAKLQGYKQSHTFVKWDEIEQILQLNLLFENQELYRKELMNSLKNEWFIKSEDYSDIIELIETGSLQSNDLWYLEGKEYANISQGFVSINIPKLFVQSKQEKKLVRDNLHGLQPDPPFLNTSDWSIDSLLNTYCKRLSKRKKDLVSSCIQNATLLDNVGQPQYILCYIPEQAINQSLDILHSQESPTIENASDLDKETHVSRNLPERIISNILEI